MFRYEKHIFILLSILEGVRAAGEARGWRVQHVAGAAGQQRLLCFHAVQERGQQIGLRSVIAAAPRGRNSGPARQLQLRRREDDDEYGLQVRF